MMHTAKPPSTVYPVNARLSQRFSAPARQYSQVPSVLCSQAIPTLAPIAKRCALLLIFSTVPTTWCPGINGDLRGGNSPSITCKSVRHTPQARTRTSTSPVFGCGVAISRYSSGFVSIAAGARNTHAFMVKPRRHLSPFDAPSLVFSALQTKYGTLEFDSHRNRHVHRNHRTHRHDRSARPERGRRAHHHSRAVRRAITRRFEQYRRKRLLPDHR